MATFVSFIPSVGVASGTTTMTIPRPLGCPGAHLGWTCGKNPIKPFITPLGPLPTTPGSVPPAPPAGAPANTASGWDPYGTESTLRGFPTGATALTIFVAAVAGIGLAYMLYRKKA